MNNRVEMKWKKEVARDALELAKTKDIVVNGCLRFVFSTMTRPERAKLYKETPYSGLKKVSA